MIKKKFNTETKKKYHSAANWIGNCFILSEHLKYISFSLSLSLSIYIYNIYIYICIIVIVIGNGISNLGEVVCISFQANIVQKGTNPSIFLSCMGEQ